MHNLKVLFVCSGNNDTGISPNVDVQATGLEEAGVDVHFFEIRGKGTAGYVKNIFKLRRHLKSNNYDIIHAHYGLSGIVCTLAGASPLVVTIMGSELHLNRTLRSVMILFVRHVWSKVFVQSEQMKRITGGGNTVVLPNGVDINRFTSVSRQEALRKTGYNSGKHIIWVSDPLRPEKNFKLAGDAIALLKERDIKLEVIFGKPYIEIPHFFRAADALLLTSRWEGSPNVVKEALAAELPVVSVDVGDVRELIDGVEGCYIANSNPEDIAEALTKALTYGKETNGLDKVKHLDMKIISERIKDVYNSIVVR